MTQSELESAIAAIERTLAMGQLRVDFADRSVTYRSTDDLLKALDYFKQQLAVLVSGRSKQTVLVASKGLAC